MTADVRPENTPTLRRRVIAIIYDAIILIGVVISAVAILVIPWSYFTGSDLVSTQIGRFFLQCYIYLVIGLFFVYFWTHGGQTLGMKAWRMMLVDNEGYAVTPEQAIKRYVFASIILLPLGLGLWMSYFHPQKLAWHDRWSGTRLLAWDKKRKQSAKHVEHSKDTKLT